MQRQSFRPCPDPRPLIEEALELAIKQSAGNKKYNISDGQLVYEEHRRYRYAYKLERTWDLADATDSTGVFSSINLDSWEQCLARTSFESIATARSLALPDL